MALASNLEFSDVKAGDEIPDLVYDCTATTVAFGAIATRDIRPMHHDRDFAQNRNGVKDIFLNTPNLAHWFERYLTDWSGPKGRLGRMKFFMRGSVFAGDHMTFKGVVEKVETDDAGCGWAEIDVKVLVEGNAMTTCSVRMALPSDANDNPWQRRGDQWQP
jgi:hypothetical protein